MSPPGTIKHLVLEAQLEGPKPMRKIRIVLDDMGPLEVCEVLQHELSALFVGFDVEIKPKLHTLPTDP